jgi:hypothetical protein
MPAALVSPNDLDFVHHLGDAFHSSNRRLGKLLVVEAWHLAPENKRTLLEVAPNPLHGQMRLMANSLLGYVSSPASGGVFWIRFSFHRRFSVTGTITKEVAATACYPVNPASHYWPTATDAIN